MTRENFDLHRCMPGKQTLQNEHLKFKINEQQKMECYEFAKTDVDSFWDHWKGLTNVCETQNWAIDQVI